MAGELDGTRELLRAFADANDNPFRLLEIELQRLARRPLPQRALDIFRHAGPGDPAYVVVSVSAVRPSGNGVTWSVAVTMASHEATVTAAIELDGDGGSVAVVERQQSTSDLGEAARLIGGWSAEICADRGWIDAPDPA